MRTVAVDSTLLNLIQSCHYKWFLSYVKELTLPGHLPDYIESGDMMHVALKVYYKHPSRPFDERVERAIERAERHAEKKLNLPPEAIREDMEIFRLYCNYYQGEACYPIAVEQPFSIIIYENEEDDLRILLEGIIDLIVEERGRQKIYDHKSTERQTQPIGFVNQNLSYCLATGLSEVWINQIGMQQLYTKKGERTAREDSERFKRWPMSYSTAIVERFRANVVRTVKDLLWSVDTGQFPQNLTSCFKFNRPCAFLSLCETEPDLRGWKAARDYVVRDRWDPLKRDIDDEED